MVAIINRSDQVSSSEVKAIADACDVQMGEFCRDWDFKKWNVKVGGDGYVKLVLVNTDADVPGALGYHDLTDGRPVGFAMTDPTLQQGASVLGPGGVASVVSHELLEIRLDMYCNFSAMSFDGWVYWLEACDAVQSTDYDYAGMGVHVSNYCRKAYFNPQAGTLTSKQDPPYDRLGKLRGPFTVDQGGYQVRNRPGAEAQVNGHTPPNHGWRTLQRIKNAASVAGKDPERVIDELIELRAA